MGMANEMKKIVMKTGIEMVCHKTAAVCSLLGRGVDNGATLTFPIEDPLVLFGSAFLNTRPSFGTTMFFSRLEASLSGFFEGNSSSSEICDSSLLSNKSFAGIMNWFLDADWGCNGLWGKLKQRII